MRAWLGPKAVTLRRELKTVKSGGALKIMPIFYFGMDLIHTLLFEHVNMGRDFKSATQKVEQK